MQAKPNEILSYPLERMWIGLAVTHFAFDHVAAADIFQICARMFLQSLASKWYCADKVFGLGMLTSELYETPTKDIIVSVVRVFNG
jgi:hypothetical protein